MLNLNTSTYGIVQILPECYNYSFVFASGNNDKTPSETIFARCNLKNNTSSHEFDIGCLKFILAGSLPRAFEIAYAEA